MTLAKRIRRVYCPIMRRIRVSVAVISLALLNVWAFPGPADAATAITYGQVASAATPPFACAASTLFVQDSTTGGTPYTPASAGVVTSWSVYSPAGGTDVVQLKFVQESPADTYTVKGTSLRQRLASAGVNTFPTRIPVAAGELPGLFVREGSAPCGFNSGTPGDVMRFLGGVHPEPLNGDTIVTNASAASTRLNLSFQWEPDADGDGYGDATQDQCPTRAAHQGDCASPETKFGKVKKTVRTTKPKAKVKLRLISTAAGATFTCSVDGKKPKPCTSPFKPKLKIGTHIVYVTSTDPAGNTDPTAATVRIKVKKKA